MKRGSRLPGIWLLIGALGPLVGVEPFTVKPADAAPVVDQQQSTFDTTVGRLLIGGADSQKLAQTVTAGISGVLTAVRLPVTCEATANLVVEIQGVTSGGLGEPDGAVLTSQTITGASLPSFPGGVVSFRDLVFSDPVFFDTGDRFAIVLTTGGTCQLVQGPLGDSYPGGIALFAARTVDPGWHCICGFTGARSDLPFQTLVESNPEVEVSIDIKPGGVPNNINPKSRGRIPVAVLSSPEFDAPAVVDHNALTFGRRGDETSLAFCTSPEDVNGDGLLDLVCHFETSAAGFQPGDTHGILKGRTLSGVPLKGSDSIRVVPSR